MSQVKVAINSKNNQVFTAKTTPSKDGKTYGFYIVESNHTSMEGGFIRTTRRTATLTVDVAQNPGWTAGFPLSGKIVIEESHTPFYEGQEVKINPTTKEAVLVNGKPVYRQSRYTENVNAQDVLLVNSVANTTTTPAVKLNEAVRGMN